MQRRHHIETDRARQSLHHRYDLLPFVATILKKFELENDTLNQAELNEIKINENN
jgi:hypothetical protein